MAVKKSGLLAWTVALVAIGGLVGGGAIYIVRPADRQIAFQSGDASYTRGVAALEAKEGAAAVRQFAEAELYCEKAHDGVERKLKKAAPDSDEWKQLAEFEGRIYWLWARAVSDHAYAQAQAEQAPLTISDDTITGEKFRNSLAIKDSEEREKALICLLKAAELLPNDLEVQKNVLRVELMNQPMSWERVERLSQQIIKLDPADTRAQYMLARYDFEQPDKKDDLYVVKPAEKRVVSRMIQASEHLAKSKQSGKYPVWRTLYLEAQLRAWFRDHAARNKKTTDRHR